MRNPSRHRYISQRLSLNYVDWGNPDAPPLLLVHGGLDHCRNWDWVAEAFADEWHVIAPDLRGHGDSDHAADGTYQMFDYVYDIAELIEQLQLAPLTIIGHSMGGNIALRYTGMYPENVRRLVAIEGLGHQATRDLPDMPGQMSKWFAQKRLLASRQPRRYPDVETAALRMREANAALTEAQAHHLTVHGLRRDTDGTWVWKFDNDLRLPSPIDISHATFVDLMAAISCPVLLCHGQDSWATNPAEDGRSSYFRDARVVSFADAGHWPHHDQFDAFMREMRAFIA